MNFKMINFEYLLQPPYAVWWGGNALADLGHFCAAESIRAW